jgi:signal transduction histidine kinase
VEIGFPIQGVWETLSKLNILFVLGLLILGLLSSGYRGKFHKRSLFAWTFGRKLRWALICFTIIPTLLFGILGKREIRLRLDEETKSRGNESLEALKRIVERDLGKSRGQSGVEEVIFSSDGERVYADFESAIIEIEGDFVIDSRYIGQMASAIGQDFLLFSGKSLVSTSQEDLVQAGLVPRIMGEKPYVDLILEGKSRTFHWQSLGDYKYLVASIRLTPAGVENPVVLATPLLWHQEEVDEEVARLNNLVLMIIMSIFLLAIAMSGIVGSSLSRPISDLKEAFEKVGSGNFKVDLDKSRRDEFGRLFSSFEMMSGQLASSQKRLSEEKARIDGVLQSVGAGIMAFDREGILKVINNQAVSLVGEDLTRQVGKVLGEIEFANEKWTELIFGVEKIMRSGKGDLKHEFVIPEDEELKTIRMIVNRLIDEKGENQGVVVAFEDISESIRSQKITAWGEMARQVAHEIKNPLTPIRLSIQHLYKTYKDGVSDFNAIIEDEVKVILREIDRLLKISGDFSKYSKQEPGEMKRIEVTSVVAEIRELYEKEHGNVSYSFEYPDGEVWGLADEEDLKKVLVNLIENGREAIEAKGDLKVEVLRETTGDERIAIVVTDTGIGIPKSDIPRIFDPNFSTRSGGTGLGLAICKRIVEGWGGKIAISSREGEGTSVQVNIKSA